MKLLILLLLISCGKKDESVVAPMICSIDTDLVRTAWQSTVSGNTYDMTMCGHSTVCRMCVSAFCDGPLDVDIAYYPNGDVVIDYFMMNNVILGEWEVCNGQLKLYNLSNGLSDELFKEI